MGLRDKYTQAAPTPAPAKDAEDSGLTSVLNPPVPASVGLRDLSALRAKLAQSNGGVNPPEAKEALTEDLFVPTTRETADGGAEEIPAALSATASTASEPAPTKRKRRTKAEMEAEKAQLSRRHPEMSPPREAPAPGGTIDPPALLMPQPLAALAKGYLQQGTIDLFSNAELLQELARRLG